MGKIRKGFYEAKIKMLFFVDFVLGAGMVLYPE